MARALGKFSRYLQDIADTGNKVCPTVHGPLARKEQDDEIIRNAACLFHYWISGVSRRLFGTRTLERPAAPLRLDAKETGRAASPGIVSVTLVSRRGGGFV